MSPVQDAQQQRPGAQGESVMFETWYEGLEAVQGTAEQRKFWADLLAIRAGAAKLLEGMRNEGKIGAALEAEVTAHAEPALRARLSEVADELRFFFITSELRLADASSPPPDAIGIDVDNAKVWITAQPSDRKKCVRCWHYRPDVGTVPEHPEICGRCVSNLPGGSGENRRWF